MSRTEPFLNAIGKIVRDSIKLPQPQTLDEDGYEVPHEVSALDFFSRDSVNQAMGLIQDVIEKRFSVIGKKPEIPPENKHDSYLSLSWPKVPFRTHRTFIFNIGGFQPSKIVSEAFNLRK